MIHTIISGGQYGADQAGLRVAIDLGLKTGGMVPKGWKTKFGPRPQLQKLGLIEHPSSVSYVPRTKWNVKHSDATIRFAFNYNSAGEICTYKAIKQYNKPYFDIDLNDVISGENLYMIDVVQFLIDNHVEVLNIAGNVGKNKKDANRIYTLTRNLLINIIMKYNEIVAVKDYVDVHEVV